MCVCEAGFVGVWTCAHPHSDGHVGRHTERVSYHGGRSWSGPDPKGGGGGPLQTPKWLYRTIGFVGAGDFVLGIWQGEIFVFDPMCLYSKYSEFCGEFKNG